jgi:nitroreductase
MDIYEAIHRRRSHRSYQPDPPSREVLERIIAAALGAPSVPNAEDGEIAVLAGQVRDKFVDLVSQATKYLLPALQEAGYPEKGQEMVLKFFKNLGGAPVVIAVTIRGNPDPGLNLANLHGGSALMQKLLLAAQAEGLGTCWMAGANYLEKEILAFLGKPEQRLLAITPIGYPAKEPPAPPRKGREVRWLGF